MPTVRQKWAFVLAFLFVGLSLGPSLAHLFALPNKIGLSREGYFTVQAIYRGWALLGVVVIAALVSSLTLTILLRRHQPGAARWAGSAFLCLAGAQALFWIYTFPANQATNDWTAAPPGWETLRLQWEYAHTGGAVLNVIALLALVMSVLAWGPAGRAGTRFPPTE